MDLDKTDRRLIFELGKDARATYRSLAKTARISKDAAIYRIRRLESAGIIKGYYAVIDYSALGMVNYKLYLKLSGPSALESLTCFCQKMKTVNYLITVAEDYDIVINFNEQNAEDFYMRQRDILKGFSSYITKKEIAITHAIHHYDESFIIDKEPGFLCTTGKRSEVKLAKTEKRILEMMADDARISAAELGRTLILPASTIAYSIRSLKKKTINCFRAKIDYSLLGYSRYKVMLNLQCSSEKDYSTVFTYISRMKCLMFITESSASHDLEFEILCKSQLELVERIQGLRKDFSTAIKDIRTRLMLQVHKVSYL